MSRRPADERRRRFKRGGLLGVGLAFVLAVGLPPALETQTAPRAAGVPEQAVFPRNSALTGYSGRGDQLTWPPPRLERPEVIYVPQQPQTLELEPERDYLVVLPETPLTRGLTIRGGRNIVMIGGEIDIPWQGEEPTIRERRAILIEGQTGVVHVEGLWLRGDDLSEGIQIDAPQARVQLQNIRVERVTARDTVDFTDNHPDVVQPYGGVEHLRIDRLTAYTDYQGLFLVGSLGPIGAVDLRHVNIVGLPSSRYLLWRSGDFRLEIDEVYAAPAPGRSWDRTVWHPPDFTDVRSGRPPEGDFVPLGVAGLDYESPGYLPPTWQANAP